jgi:hypothetical protein
MMPLFVADPYGKSEEDGFIFSFVHQQGEPGGSFVVLNARYLSGKPLATVHLPRRIPAALHGSWIPERLAGYPSRRRHETLPSNEPPGLLRSHRFASSFYRQTPRRLSILKSPLAEAE